MDAVRRTAMISSLLALLACSSSHQGPDPAGMPDAGSDDAGPGLDASDDPICAYSPPPWGARECGPIEPFDLAACNGSRFVFRERSCDARYWVLSFVAAWDALSVRQTPQFTDLAAEYRDRGVRVIQILLQDESHEGPTLAFCSDWTESHSLGFPVLIDPLQLTGIYFGRVMSIPAALIVDSEGVLRERVIGASPDLESLRLSLDELLLDPTHGCR